RSSPCMRRSTIDVSRLMASGSATEVPPNFITTLMRSLPFPPDLPFPTFPPVPPFPPLLPLLPFPPFPPFLPSSLSRPPCPSCPSCPSRHLAVTATLQCASALRSRSQLRQRRESCCGRARRT